MLGLITAFFLGVFLAPAIRPLFRPLLVEVIRAGMVVSEEVNRASSSVRETVEDATAEASAARQREQREQREPSEAGAAGTATTARTEPPPAQETAQA